MPSISTPSATSGAHDSQSTAWRSPSSPRPPAPRQNGDSRPGEAELVAIAERLAGPEGLTEKANTFRRADVLRAWAAARPAGLGASHLEALTDWYLAQPDFAVALEDGRYTTPGLLGCEHELLALVDQGRDSHTAVLPPEVVDRALARAPVQLSAEQEGVVRALTSSGHGIENLEALAGTGKTTVCGVLASAYTAGGYHVIGATPTARAARELAAVGVEADTIDAILTRLRNRPTLAPRRLVILADENGMAGTRPMAELAAWARRGGAKIIQVGDSHQLAGVPASGEFAAVTRRHGAEQLTEVRRQRDTEEIAALAELRDGLPERYLAHQLQQRRLRIAPDQKTATDEAAFWWRRAAAEHGPHRVALITRDNDLRAELNAAVRQHRAIRGELDGPILEASGATLPARRPHHLPPKRPPHRRRQRHARHDCRRRSAAPSPRRPSRRRPPTPATRRIPRCRPRRARLRAHRP